MSLRTRSSRFMMQRVLRSTRGAAVVEFAIIFPVLAMLIFGVIDFGRAFFLRTNLVAAVREGARSGATDAVACSSAGIAAIQARVQQYVTSFGGASVTANVTTPGGCATGAVTNVVVTITNYTFTPVTPVFRLINYTTALRITVSATYRWERSDNP